MPGCGPHRFTLTPCPLRTPSPSSRSPRVAPPPPVHAAPRAARAVGVVLLVVTATLWSISGVMVKVVQIDPIAFAFWRSLWAGAAMLAVLPVVGLPRDRMPEPRWMAFSVVIYAAVVSLLVTAMTRGTAASGILLQYTAPVFCALFAWVLQRRAIGGRTAAALVIALAGVLVMIAGAPKGSDVIGPVCGVLSGAAFGGLILVLEKLDRIGRGRVSPVAIVLFNNLGTAALLLPLCLLRGTLVYQPWQLGLVALTGLVQLAIPYLLFQLALRRVNPVDASLLTLLEPMLNPVWVWLMVGERPDAFTYAGGAAILLAMVLEATKRREEAPGG